MPQQRGGVLGGGVASTTPTVALGPTAPIEVLGAAGGGFWGGGGELVRSMSSRPQLAGAEGVWQPAPWHAAPPKQASKVPARSIWIEWLHAWVAWVACMSAGNANEGNHTLLLFLRRGTFVMSPSTLWPAVGGGAAVGAGAGARGSTVAPELGAFPPGGTALESPAWTAGAGAVGGAGRRGQSYAAGAPVPAQSGHEGVYCGPRAGLGCSGLPTHRLLACTHGVLWAAFPYDQQINTVTMQGACGGVYLAGTDRSVCPVGRLAQRVSADPEGKQWPI